MRGERNERQVTFHPTNERGRSSAAQSFRNEFRQHRDELEQEIGRIARELEEMRHVHAIENCEGEATCKDYVGEQSPALPARIPVHYSRKGRSKRHVSSTPVDKGRDKPETTVAENSRPTRESVSRDGCRRRHQIHYNQRGDSQLGFVEHSSEDYSVESDTTSTDVCGRAQGLAAPLTLIPTLFLTISLFLTTCCLVQLICCERVLTMCND